MEGVDPLTPVSGSPVPASTGVADCRVRNVVDPLVVSTCERC